MKDLNPSKLLMLALGLTYNIYSQTDTGVNVAPGEFPNGPCTITKTADGARDIATVDLDGDGDPDVLSASFEDDRIAWYRNDGNGNFISQTTISAEADGAMALTVADIDGDGDPDVLSASFSDDRIAWYENDGNGIFGTQRNINTFADGAQDVAVADLDGDGDLDVLSASFEDDRIAWYENDGIGNFGSQRTVTMQADGAIAVTVADLDNDGNMDVISASNLDNRIAWYRNDGNGNFGNPMTITLEATAAFDVGVADLDGDGDTDVLSASVDDNQVSWYRNDGNGNFGTRETITTETGGPVALATADLDGDGDLDVLSANVFDNRITWFRNDGNGNFSETQTITIETDRAAAVVTADLDGDGDLDVLSASFGDDRIAWYENTLPLQATCVDPFTIQLDENGKARVTVADIDNGSTGAKGMQIDIAGFDCSHLGMNTVTLTVTNTKNATDNCSTTVTVKDTIAPKAITRDISVQLDANGRAVLSPEDVDGGSTDNCSIAERSLDISVFECPPLAGTEVTLTVTDLDSNTSSATAMVTFEADDHNSDGVADLCSFEATVHPSNGITPNGDGINDVWVIRNITDFPNAQVKVFDRNGREVFHADHYTNNWGGTRKKGLNLLPAGPYYYILHLQRPSEQNVTGWLYINY